METNPRGETDRDARRRRARCRGRAPERLVPNRSIRSTSRAPWSRSFLASTYVGERPGAPMIDLSLSKEKAVGAHIWGLIYDGWAPDPEEQGVTVFLRGTSIVGRTTSESGSTSRQSRDLVTTRYRGKLTRFFDRLLAASNAGKPLMSQFYANYLDMYWDLHVGVQGAAIPAEVRALRASTPCSATPSRRRRSSTRTTCARGAAPPCSKTWLDTRVQAIIDGDLPDADRTFVYYWLKNGWARTSAGRTSSSSASTTCWRLASGAR